MANNDQHPSQLIAHTPADATRAPQLLEDHLSGVAERAAAFVEAFADPGWGRLAGFWHDLGKAAPDWQAFIRRAMVDEEDLATDRGKHGPPHAALGAIRSMEWQPKGWMGQTIAFAIAGHHAGVPDRERLREQVKDDAHRKRYCQASSVLDEGARDSSLPAAPAWLNHSPRPEQVELFTRLLFSALVDADFLDTEEYRAISGDAESIEKAAARADTWPSLPDYDRKLDSVMEEKQRSAPETIVNGLRKRVLESCVAASLMPPGAFSLTVPTGGGKTLSSLAFALKHAISNEQRRVVIALPFTAIIDQTADVLRGAFDDIGDEVVLEHHSAVDPETESRVSRVSSENWDAPLVVTTQVQLFESLFANRPSKCRKLHNLVRSIIILDEVQNLPHGVLEPILDVLNELVAHYGVTLLLTTATQPSLHSRPLGGGSFKGLDPAPREIIDESLRAELWKGLRRVEVMWPKHEGAEPEEDATTFWALLAEEIAAHERVLAIVHLKKDAQALHRALCATCPEALHLSAAMCPAHRRKKLAEVKRRLSAGEPCRLVSTQVIEAGVDVDFPVVYRAMAGLESLAQSAGRCNREGRLDGLGQFHVFEAPTRPPQSLRLHQDIAKSMLLANANLDLLEPETFVRYFDRVYANRKLDAKDVQALRGTLCFASTANAFQMIDESSESMFVYWNGEARRLIGELRRFGPSRKLLRRLQSYAVSIYPQQKRALERQSALENVSGYLVLADFEPSIFYSDDVGLVTEADASINCIA